MRGAVTAAAAAAAGLDCRDRRSRDRLAGHRLAPGRLRRCGSDGLRRLSAGKRASPFRGLAHELRDIIGTTGRHRFLGVRTADVEDIILVLAECADIGLAIQREAHRNGIGLIEALDRLHRAGQRRLEVTEIEFQPGGEFQRDIVGAAIGGNRDHLRKFEHVTREGRLGRDPYARRHVIAFGHIALRADRAFRQARTARQFLDHLFRQAGRQALPGVGQQIDIEPLARRHRIDDRLAAERDDESPCRPDRGARHRRYSARCATASRSRLRPVA